MVEYSSGYLADHWCQVGHFVHCLEGKFTLELIPSGIIEFKGGDGFIVSDELSSHRILSQTGGKLLIVDGDFLQPNKTLLK